MSVNFKNKLNDYANMTNHNVRCGKAGRLFIALKSYIVQGFPGGSEGKLPAMPETWVQSLGQEDPLEKEMAMHSSILAWEILWTEKPGRLPSSRLKRAGHDLVSKQQQEM